MLRLYAAIFASFTSDFNSGGDAESGAIWSSLSEFDKAL